VVGPLTQRRADDDSGGSWSQRAHSALGYCLRGAQLRLTLPLALLAGAILTLVNMGGQLMHGRLDLGMCAMCAMDFLVPFIALNVAPLSRAPRRTERPHRTGNEPAPRPPVAIAAVT
jgi:hypothetical protein